MRLICWNCRGIACSHAIRNLRANIRTLKPDVVFLLETLLFDVKTLGIVNRLGFYMYVNIPPTGKWVGLLFM